MPNKILQNASTSMSHFRKSLVNAEKKRGEGKLHTVMRKREKIEKKGRCSFEKYIKRKRRFKTF